MYTNHGSAISTRCTVYPQMRPGCLEWRPRLQLSQRCRLGGDRSCTSLRIISADLRALLFLRLRWSGPRRILHNDDGGYATSYCPFRQRQPPRSKTFTPVSLAASKNSVLGNKTGETSLVRMRSCQMKQTCTCKTIPQRSEGSSF